MLRVGRACLAFLRGCGGRVEAGVNEAHLVAAAGGVGVLWQMERGGGGSGTCEERPRTSVSSVRVVPLLTCGPRNGGDEGP